MKEGFSVWYESYAHVIYFSLYSSILLMVFWGMFSFELCHIDLLNLYIAYWSPLDGSRNAPC